MSQNILWFDQISLHDLNRVGGKNASLGEMYNQLTQSGIKVPNGFATAVNAFKKFLYYNQLEPIIHQQLNRLDVNNTEKLHKAGKSIRHAILNASLPPDLVKEIQHAWEVLQRDNPRTPLSVAVRSSATAEDLPDASFAGQQETFLNVCGIDQVLQAIIAVYASLYTDRAISYRAHQHIANSNIHLSACIQKMVRSDLATSGVMFSLDTESGFSRVVMITSSYGLGEAIVQGAVTPDEFYVYKPNQLVKKSAILQRKLGNKTIKMIYAPSNSQERIIRVATSIEEQIQFSLNDKEIEELAKQALLIENHYGKPMDIEWAKDGNDGQLYIVQARPETVQSHKSSQQLEIFSLKQQGSILIEGRSIGQRIAHGVARVIRDSSEMGKVAPGDVLITDMTDPDWEPVMKRAAAIVTNRGGRTCHAAIIAREFNLAAVVGCGNATDLIKDGTEVTVDCSQGDVGYVYAGKIDFELKKIDVKNIPKIPTKIMMNVGNPERAFAFSKIPNEGIGLTRLEFIVNNLIGIHPQALLNLKDLPADTAEKIKLRTAAYVSPIDFYIEKLAEGIATIAAAFYPKPIIVRLSDFKSNEYKNLLGGQYYEPTEENPMLGFRGAGRYISPAFKPAFALECKALRKVRDVMGFNNVQIMVPFVRTVKQASKVIDTLAEQGLQRGVNNLKIIMMCEIPSNAILAEEFLQYFDGFSIGSNDLTQLTLGVDRDSALVAEDFDERDAAVKFLLKRAIDVCRHHNKYIGICGQGPSDYPDFAQWLINQGIESISLVPDTVLETLLYLANDSKERPNQPPL